MALFLLFTVYLSISSTCTGTTEDKFNDFIKSFNKNYHPATAEYMKRKHIFGETLKRVEWLNKHRLHNRSAFYGITEFSDLTPDEFHAKVIKRWTTHNPSKLIHIRSKREVDFKKIENLPQKIDWRESGIIGSIRNQDKCGACWAFSTVETIESMQAMKTKSFEELSVQQLVDCSIGNHGCNGGDTCTALEWLSQNDVPVLTEFEYPFRDETQSKCEITPKIGIRINSNFTCDNYTNNEAELLGVLAYHGPVVAAVDASGWQDYLGGIIQYHCDNKRNHAVQIVGYDLTGDIPYYIVRNSWGIQFGINGYLHIAIGKNLCAISEEISALSVK